MSVSKSCMLSLTLLSLSIANFDDSTSFLNNSRNSTTVPVSISTIATTAKDTAADYTTIRPVTTTADFAIAGDTSSVDDTTSTDATTATDATTLANSTTAGSTTSLGYTAATGATALGDFTTATHATTANATTADSADNTKLANATTATVTTILVDSTIATDTTTTGSTTATDATTIRNSKTATPATKPADAPTATNATSLDSTKATHKTVADSKRAGNTTSADFTTATDATKLANSTTANDTALAGSPTATNATSLDSTKATHKTVAESTRAGNTTSADFTTATDATKLANSTTANDTALAGSPTATNATSLDSTKATHKTVAESTRAGNTTSADFTTVTDATTVAYSTTLTDATIGGDSTVGREFIVMFLQTIVIEKDPTLIVATTDNSCVVTVAIPKIFYFRIYKAAARTKLEIAIPKSVVPKSDGLDNLGILIKSTADISLWGMHDANSRSVDGFLALPTKVLGREYFGVSYKPYSGAELGVVGIDDDTTVTITYDRPYTFGDRKIIANYPLKVKLDRFETLFINLYTDITGIHIESSAPVAAFSGNQCAFIPLSFGYCNHIVTQLVPFERWGMKYVVTPFFGHIDYVVKVVTGRYSSTVRVGERQHVLGEMTSLTLNLTSIEVITAARPVLVVQFSSGKTLDNGNSYPTMTLVPAIQQFTNAAVIATFSDYHPSLHYLNLVATCFDLEKQYIRIDETQIEFTRKEIYVDGIAYCISQMLLNTSYSRITTIKPNVTFTAIIHERTDMFSTTRATKLRLTNTTCYTANEYGVTLTHNCDEEVVIFTYPCPEPCPDKKEELYCGPCIDGLAVFIVMFFSSGLTICVEQVVRCCRAACKDEWEVEAWKRKAVMIQQRPDTSAWDRQIEAIRKNELKKLQQEF